jgi:hypothetical protein
MEIPSPEAAREVLKELFRSELQMFTLGDETSEHDQPEANDSLLTISPDMMGWGEQNFLEMTDADRTAIEQVLCEELGIDYQTLGQRMWMVGNKDMSVDFPDF